MCSQAICDAVGAGKVEVPVPDAELIPNDKGAEPEAIGGFMEVGAEPDCVGILMDIGAEPDAEGKGNAKDAKPEA